MDADYEDRTADRLRAEVAEAVPDDLTPPPLPDLVAQEVDETDDDVVRIRVHSPVWPFAVAAAVAVIAVATTIWVRPDPATTTAGPSATTTAAATPTASTTDRSASPDPNVFWVPMSESAAARADDLLAAWDAEGAAPPPPPNSTGIPVVESASFSETGVLMVEVVGAALGTGSCESQQDVAVLESPTAVVVLVTTTLPPPESVEAAPETCPAVGHILELPVGLSEPLGDRALLDLNRWTAQFGGPVEVEVEGVSSEMSTTVWTASPDANVFWVPMAPEAATSAEDLLQAWDSGEGFQEAASGMAPYATVDETGALTLHTYGPALGFAPCQGQQDVAVQESETAVVVRITPHLPKTGSAFPMAEATCQDVAHLIALPVPLSAPLGDRALLDFTPWTYGERVRIPVTPAAD